MQPHRYLAISELPSGVDPDVRAQLERIVHESRARGVRPVETFYSLERGRAYTYVEAESADDVRAAYGAAGLTLTDVMAGERIHTELLGETKR